MNKRQRQHLVPQLPGPPGISRCGIINFMNTVLQPVMYALGLVSVIAASFAAGMVVGESTSADYDFYLAVAIAVAIIAIMAAVILFLLQSRRGQG